MEWSLMFIRDSLVQEIGIEVRAVNAGMTTRTIAAGLETQAPVRHVSRKRIDVALQTEKTLFAAHQQHPVHAPVRSVAGGTTFHLDGRVLKHKRPTLFSVTLRAGLPSALPQRRAVGSSVGIVAIRALHRAFRDTMMRRQGELRLYVPVAAEAQLRLRFL